MKTKRRKFTAAFKAQVVLAAIQEREKLYAKIGQLQVERDWLKKT